jgi:hypothetical protein
MPELLQKRKFGDVDLHDSFFDSLKGDYKEFESWFQGKAEEEAYLIYGEPGIEGFMYLKPEDGPVTDVDPALPSARRIKIGTLKIDAHGTLLGERLIKKALDHTIAEKATDLYLTVFPRHRSLINMLQEYGFVKTGTKTTRNGEEWVLVKSLSTVRGILKKDYPLIVHKDHAKFILSIYPEWHTKLFPDSILENETFDIVQDISYTNSIQKTYVCFMDLSVLKSGDIIIIYRTRDKHGPAWYRSVVTSVCTIEEVYNKTMFADSKEYIDYTEKFSVFNKDELLGWWNRGDDLYVLKMLYNAAFSKRLIRRDLVESIGLDADAYWGFMSISDEDFLSILQNGGIDEHLIVD